MLSGISGYSKVSLPISRDFTGRSHLPEPDLVPPSPSPLLLNPATSGVSAAIRGHIPPWLIIGVFPHPAAAKPYACLKRSPTSLCESAHESRGRLFLLGPAPRGRRLLFISRCSSVPSWRYPLDEEGLKQNLCSGCLLLHRAQSGLMEEPRV